MNKRKQGNRGYCTLCQARGEGGVGHIAELCAFKGGPYEGRASVAIAEAKRRRQQKKTKGSGAASSATGGVDIFAVEIREEIKGSLDSHSKETSRELSAQVDSVKLWKDAHIKLEGVVAHQGMLINNLFKMIKDLTAKPQPRQQQSNGSRQQHQQGKGKGQDQPQQRRQQQQQPGEYAQQQQREYDDGY
jgi:hypothetical protein